MKRVAATAYRQAGRSLQSAGGHASMATQMPQARRRQKPSALVPLFIFSLALPFYFFIGPTRMSPYRIVLVVTFVPCLMAWLSGALGKPRLPDVLMCLAGMWGAMVLIMMHGADKGLQSAGIFVIETFGAYLFARKYIRDVVAFQHMAKFLAIMVIGLLPFAVYENVMGRPILIDVFGKMFPVYNVLGDESRLGLRRAQGPFEHFILFGVVCSSAFAVSFYAVGAPGRLGGKLASAFVAMAVFSSLSSGAIMSVVVQVILIVWDKITARMSGRWAILAAIFFTGFVAVNLASNRSPFEVLITYLTFNADTSYMRVLIWRYGSEAVMLHPIFGHGLDDWERPLWMGGSIDNFWLVNAVRFGIPGALLMAGSFLAVCFGLGGVKNLTFEANQCRKGLIFAICGLIVSLCTVHVWDAVYVLIIFLLGSGMWIFDSPKQGRSTFRSSKNDPTRRFAHAGVR
ncbi:MAG TPA: O-antigen ligase family protein [Tardiphaga sp.]